MNSQIIKSNSTAGWLKPGILICALLLLYLPTWSSAQTKDDANLQVGRSRSNLITKAVAEASPAVAGISAIMIREYARTPFPRDPFFSFLFGDGLFRQKVRSLGSGFLISSDGYLLTNAHVIEDADEVIATLSDGTEHEAEIIGSDEMTDVALLKLSGEDYPFLRIGDSEDILIGEWVIALGNPFGLFDINKKPTATVGVVSAIDLDFGQQQSGKVYQDMIQTDASINSGNSGGPLLNALGDVIGINTFIFTGSRYTEGSIGIGFAIPINRAKEVADELKELGKVDRSFWTGLSVRNVNRLLAKHLELKSDRGVIIVDIVDQSPADKAGLQIGDIILSVNGQEVLNDDDILPIIEESFLRAGDTLDMTVKRGSEKKSIKLKLEKPNG